MQERAFEVASRLAGASGGEVMIVGLAEGIRLNLEVPESGADHQAVAEALTEGDRYGHRRRGGRDHVWCEFDLTPKPRPVPAVRPAVREALPLKDLPPLRVFRFDGLEVHGGPEMAVNVPGCVAIRAAGRPSEVVVLSTAEWEALKAAIRAGKFEAGTVPCDA